MCINVLYVLKCRLVIYRVYNHNDICFSNKFPRRVPVTVKNILYKTKQMELNSIFYKSKADWRNSPSHKTNIKLWFWILESWTEWMLKPSAQSSCGAICVEMHIIHYHAKNLLGFISSLQQVWRVRISILPLCTVECITEGGIQVLRWPETLSYAQIAQASVISPFHSSSCSPGGSLSGELGGVVRSPSLCIA